MSHVKSGNNWSKNQCMYLLFYWFTLLRGWKIDKSIKREEYRQAVIISAPHTSNWDFIYAMAAFHYLKVPIRFTIKKEWMRFPLGLLIRPLGGVAIDRRPKENRSKQESFTQSFIDLFEKHKHEDFCVLFTPEATRKRREQWKTGFYHVAKGINRPLALSYMDYKTKKVGIGKIIHTTDNMEADMRSVMEFYQTVNAKFPENFSVDQRYI